MKKILALAFALIMALSLVACGDDPTPANGGTPGTPGEVVVSNTTDKWPSGVYNAYGVPEYKAGKIVYAYPGDDSGSVFISTTHDEFTAYVEELRDAGFRIKDTFLEDAQSADGWGHEYIFMPEAGTGYALSFAFSFENDGKGTNSSYYSGDGEEVFFDYNVSLSMSYYEEPVKNITSDLLKKFGIKNEDFIPEDMDSAELTTMTEEPYSAFYTFGFPFDYMVSEEVCYDFVNGLIDAFAKVADDGELFGAYSGEPLDIETAKEDKTASWSFKYDGKTYMVTLLNSYYDYDEPISMSITDATK